jgi:long-chain acyl-CoA synthetase
VRDCAVFGIPDEEFGEALAAHIELDDGAQLSAAAVHEHVGARLTISALGRAGRAHAAAPRPRRPGP